MPHTTIEQTPQKTATYHHAENALKNFELGVRYLQKQNYSKAKQVFEKLLSGTPTEVADRARAYMRICELKLQTTSPAARHADYYTLGVAELNAHRFESAVEYLSKANKSQPNRDHILYALAAAHARLGNTDSALENLEAAITLRTQNRFQARNDEDFQSLSTDPRFQALVGLAGKHVSPS